MPAPVQQPEVATAPVTQEGTYGVEDAIASITRDAVSQTIAEREPAAETPTRDANGRFVKQGEPAAEAGEPAADEGAEALPEQPAPAAPPAEVPVETGEPEAPVVLPDGMVAVPTISRELAHPFKVLDAEGEIEAPDLLIEFTANGKARKEPLDKVVKLASVGVYNHEREQSIQTARTEAQQAQAQLQQVAAYAKQLEQEREALLSNDEQYLTARAQYEQQHTPEARLARAQQELEQQAMRQGFTTAATQGQQFYATELEPAVQTITKALPTVSVDEIGAKLLLVSDRYKVHTPFGTIINPDAYGAIRQAIVNEIVPWAQQLHEARDTERRTSATQTQAEQQALKKAAADAKAEAQKARNLGTKAAKPGAGRPGTNAPTPKPIKTVDDAEQAALAETMAAMGFAKAS